MKDGLYMVNYGSICAGFVVRGGNITVCPPVLRKKIDFFKTIAKYIPTDLSIPPLRLNDSLSEGAAEA